MLWEQRSQAHDYNKKFMQTEAKLREESMQAEAKLREEGEEWRVKYVMAESRLQCARRRFDNNSKRSIHITCHRYGPDQYI